MIEIVDVKERGVGHEPSFTSPAEASTDNAVTPNKLMSYYTQYL